MTDFKDRMQEEERDLTKKINLLAEFMHSKVYCSLSEQEQYLLQDQLYPMRQYQDALKKRIALANGWVKPREDEKTCLDAPVTSCGRG